MLHSDQYWSLWKLSWSRCRSWTQSCSQGCSASNHRTASLLLRMTTQLDWKLVSTQRWRSFSCRVYRTMALPLSTYEQTTGPWKASEVVHLTFDEVFWGRLWNRQNQWPSYEFEYIRSLVPLTCKLSLTDNLRRCPPDQWWDWSSWLTTHATW